MPIALSVETGAGVAGANSFATVVQARDFATVRGVTLSADDDVVTAFLVIATDYLKTLQYQGTKYRAGESYLPWPRDGLLVDEVAYPINLVPSDIVAATCQLVIEQHNGIVLRGSASTAGIKREKVGPLETEYSSSHIGRSIARMPIVEAYLSPWLARASFGLRTRRI